MGRPNRVHVDGGIYHVIMRGNAREPIFFDANDRSQLNKFVAEALDRYSCRLHAYCWMNNHIHAAVQVSHRPLSEFMCWSASRYARFINLKRGRTGHLFERRHKAILVRDDAYLLELVRYIHLNPVRAGLVSAPENYLWGSHRAYLGTQTIKWVTTRGVLGCFGASIATSRRHYRKFMQRDSCWQPDENEVPAEGEELALSTGELSIQPRSVLPEKDVDKFIGDLVAAYCSEHNLNPAAVTGPGRQRDTARARAIISHQAISDGKCTLKNLAEYFGRDPDVILRGLQRHCADPRNQ